MGTIERRGDSSPLRPSEGGSTGVTDLAHGLRMKSDSCGQSHKTYIGGNMVSNQMIIDRIEKANPNWTAFITEHSDWFEIEVFDTNGLVWRKRSFEPDYAKKLTHFINTYC